MGVSNLRLEGNPWEQADKWVRGTEDETKGGCAQMRPDRMRSCARGQKRGQYPTEAALAWSHLCRPLGSAGEGWYTPET